MTRIRKRFERLINNPVGTKWDELVTILRHYNCEIRSGGKHFVVFHPDSDRNVTVSVHNNNVKVIYIKKLIELLEEVLDEEDFK